MYSPLTHDQCIARMRQAQERSIETQSLDPIREMFRKLNQYAKTANFDRVALANWARMYSLWDAHFDKWYREFQDGNK